MKIGDFARACKTNISVLRHYDKIGLLKPLYIDRFTEYRYYTRFFRYHHCHRIGLLRYSHSGTVTQTELLGQFL